MNTAVSAAYSLLILLVFWENFLRVSMVVIKKSFELNIEITDLLKNK